MRALCRLCFAVGWATLLLVPGFVQATTPRLERVSLQLLWYHQFQSAGYYVAQHHGFFRDVGLDVEIRHGGYDDAGLAPDPVTEVLNGQADFGISRSDLLIHHGQGLPVVVLANIMQRSPLVFLTLERYGFSRLDEIGERPISVTLPGVDRRLSAETLTSFQHAGVELATLNNSPPSWRLEDLLEGATQLIPAYSNDGPYLVSRLGETPVTISPRDYGIDFYGDLLFTREELVEQRPDLVAAFREAVLRGWEHALGHPEETVALIAEHYETRDRRYDEHFLRHEAEQLHALMQPDLIEIGYSNSQRWHDIAAIYQELGLIDDYDLSRFLYRPVALAAPPPWERLWRWVLPGGLALLLAFALATYFFLINRRLCDEMARRREAENSLRRLANSDGLTGVENRRHFEQRLKELFAQARRHGRPFSLVLFDIDHFKAINDNHGHLAGDQVLIELAAITRQVLRQEDHLARYGGEEFIALLPDTGRQPARQIAKRILETNRDHPVVVDGETLRYTLSLGVSSLTADDPDPTTLLRRADQRLYRAKRAGRDRLCADDESLPAAPLNERAPGT